jgi:ArsR family transcriptional regulator
MKPPTEPDCSEANLPGTSPLTSERLVQIAKALAHPARLRILEQFAGCRPRTVHDIVEDCTLAQSTVSEHLRILRDAEVLFATRDGAWTWYCVRRSVLAEFAAAVDDLATPRTLVEQP